jgi:hypothetical protein
VEDRKQTKDKELVNFHISTICKKYFLADPLSFTEILLIVWEQNTEPITTILRATTYNNFPASKNK